MEDLLGVQLALAQYARDLTLVFGDDLLPAADDLQKIYSDSNFSHVDLLTGVTSNEGFVPGHLAIPEILSESIDYAKCKQQLQHFLSGLYGTNNLNEITEAVIQFYIGKQIDIRGNDGQAYKFVRKRLVEIVGEALFQNPTYQGAKYQAAAVANVYFYEMSHRPYFMRQFRPSWHYGCDHNYDLLFTLGYSLISTILDDDAEFREEEYELTQTMMKYWANFVKMGYVP